MVLFSVMTRNTLNLNGQAMGLLVTFLVLSWNLLATPVVASEQIRLPFTNYPQVFEVRNTDNALAALVMIDEVISGTPQSTAPIAARVLKASLLAELERYTESRQLLLAIAEEEPTLRQFALTTVIRHLTSQGNAAQAHKYLQLLTNDQPEREHLDLILNIADTYNKNGIAQESITMYRLALRLRTSGRSADLARLGIAGIEAAAGNVERALTLYREAQTLSRTADGFIAARSAENLLVRATGATRTPLSNTQYQEHAKRLRNQARYEAALELIEDWNDNNPDREQNAVIQLERIETFYAMRANAEAKRLCEEFSRQYPTHEELPRVRLTRFRLAVREAKTDEVKNLGYGLWSGRSPGTSTTIRRSTGTLLAAYLVAVGEIKEGLAVYRELYRMTENASDRRTVLWRAGVAAIRVGQFERAALNLRGLLQRNPTGDLEPAALYWCGIAEHRLSREDHAIKLFQTLQQRFPYHYYGLKAKKRLQELHFGANSETFVPETRTITFPVLKLSVSTTQQPEFKAASILAQAGLVADAAGSVRKLLERQRGDQALALVTVRALANAGAYNQGMNILVNHFGQFLRQPAKGLPDDFWKLVYPRPFLSDVEDAGEATGVDPLLLYALMRQESRFDPNARSLVGALGLMQIMPYTAEELRVTAGLQNVLLDEEVLLQPRVNTRLGATLMRRLLTMFEGAVAPVTASYNAGEDLAAVWWQAADGLREDQFVDSIPYSETRRFVREVITNYTTYQRLYASTSP